MTSVPQLLLPLASISALARIQAKVSGMMYKLSTISQRLSRMQARLTFLMHQGIKIQAIFTALMHQGYQKQNTARIACTVLWHHICIVCTVHADFSLYQGLNSFVIYIAGHCWEEMITDKDVCLTAASDCRRTVLYSSLCSWVIASLSTRSCFEHQYCLSVLSKLHTWTMRTTSKQALE
jgi:hypothetical protein